MPILSEIAHPETFTAQEAMGSLRTGFGAALTLANMKFEQRREERIAEKDRELLKISQADLAMRQQAFNMRVEEWDKQASFAKGRYLLKSMEDLLEKVTTGPETGGLETISQEDYTDFLDRLRDFDVDVSGLPSAVSDDIVKDLKDDRDDLIRQLEAQGAIEEPEDLRYIIVGEKLHKVPKAATLEIFKKGKQKERLAYNRKGEPFPIWYEEGTTPTLPKGWSWGAPEEETELEQARAAFVAGTATPEQEALLKLASPATTVTINLEKFGMQKEMTAADLRTELVNQKDDKTYFESNSKLFNIVNTTNEVAYWQSGKWYEDEETKIIKLSAKARKAGWTPALVQAHADKGINTEQVLLDAGIITTDENIEAPVILPPEALEKGWTYEKLLAHAVTEKKSVNAILKEWGID